jgi:hypothetical protein
MDTSNFKHLLSSHAPVSQNETEELSVLLQQYPYLQSARALQLKGFKTNFDARYNQQLKITAAYTTDRSVLFDYITSHDFVVFVPKEIPSNKVVEIESFTSSAAVFNDKEISNIDDEETFNNSIEIVTPQTQLEIGKPLTFEANDTFSFNEWLQLVALKPIDRSQKNVAKTASSSTNKEQQINLIENFINTNPKIKSLDKNLPNVDFSEKGATPNENLMTETLARVYLEQKKYQNAIKAYKILCLKYPEKSGYFADQIKAIKNLQNNHIS